jgi:PPOX class probable F420-dependent enzyme
MLDTTTPKGRRAATRLAEEKVVWLTTVRPSGRPQTSPVWYLYRDGEFLVFSKAGTARTANIAANPKVSVNLDGNGTGGDIVVVEGEAHIDRSVPPLRRRLPGPDPNPPNPLQGLVTTPRRNDDHVRQEASQAPRTEAPRGARGSDGG